MRRIEPYWSMMESYERLIVLTAFGSDSPLRLRPSDIVQGTPGKLSPNMRLGYSHNPLLGGRVKMHGFA